jgi:hypothetical protein
MAQNTTNPYDVDAHIAEAYDLCETETADVELIRRLVGEKKNLRILEPFTGTGRILLPLALDGHILTGIDQAHGMLARAREKVASLPPEVQQRITLIEADVICSPWPSGFDVIILGGNCFYELATPEEQELCVRMAAAALSPGGHVYIDNDHMEGELDSTWQDTGALKKRGIQGLCRDGSRVESFMEATWFDASRRLARFRRWSEITMPDGEKVVRAYTQQKHPVSAGEVRAWLERYGFTIQHQYGDRQGTSYTERAERAIFWAVRKA